MEEKKSGAGFLKVVGILMIIFGAIALIVSLIAVAGMSALSALANAVSEATGEEINTGMLWIGLILSVVSAAMEMVAGIVGVVNAKKPEKAKTCLVFGILVAVLTVAGCIFTVASGDDFPVASLLLGLVMPVLYIIGAVKNMKAA